MFKAEGSWSTASMAVEQRSQRSAGNWYPESIVVHLLVLMNGSVWAIADSIRTAVEGWSEARGLMTDIEKRTEKTREQTRHLRITACAHICMRPPCRAFLIDNLNPELQQAHDKSDSVWPPYSSGSDSPNNTSLGICVCDAT